MFLKFAKKVMWSSKIMGIIYQVFLNFDNTTYSYEICNNNTIFNDKLIQLNVIVDNVNKDTFREKSNFFSYRRSQKLSQNDYGRCISVIAMTKFGLN